jgi:hypothetical protein
MAPPLMNNSANVSKSGHKSLAVIRRDRLAGMKSEIMAPPHIVLLSKKLLLTTQDTKQRPAKENTDYSI